MGTIIIPAAVLAALLAPFGLGHLGLAIMGPAIQWILWVAETVSGWQGAVSHVVAPDPFVLPILAFGGLWFVLWQGRLRALGMPMACVALWFWSGADRPDILVSQTGGLIGVMTPEGRALSKARGDGFAAESWLENDGDPVEQSVAHARAGLVEEGRLRRVTFGETTLLHATGKRAAADALSECQKVDLIVVNVAADAPDGCTLYDIRRLRGTGALAIRAESGGFHITTAQSLTGKRLWTP